MINRSVIGKRAQGSVPISKDQISTLKQKALRVEEIEGLRFLLGSHRPLVDHLHLFLAAQGPPV